MKKRSLQKALCVLLACVLTVSTALFAFAGTPAEDIRLHFNEDGKFRILNFSDFQDDQTLDSRAKEFISRAVYITQPDLIVLTGDNIYGNFIYNADDTTPAIAEFMNELEKLGVPVAIVFGNHDDQGQALSKAQQLAFYSTYGVNISCDPVPSLSGCGTYNIPIYGSTQRDKVNFNLWMFDTGSEPQQNILGLDIALYDHMRDDQLNWYVAKSNELKAANGDVPVPSIAFQHIVVEEIYDALKNVPLTTQGAVRHLFVEGTKTRWKAYVLPDNAVPGSELGEAPCPGQGGNEFSVVKAQGDVKAIVCGHDHKNQFIIPYQGIDLICTPSCGFMSYGSDEQCGARIFDIDEQTGSYTTRMLNLIESGKQEYYKPSGTQSYVKDIALCSVESADYASLAEAKQAAYNQARAAVKADLSASFGAAFIDDLNGGETNDVDPENHHVVCLGYTRTTNAGEAVRGLSLLYAANGEDPAAFDGATADGCVWRLCNSGSHAVAGSSGAVNLNEGTRGKPMYLYATYDASAGNPISDLRVLDTGASAINMSDFPGMNLVYPTLGANTGTDYADLNKSASGDYVYALYTRADTSQSTVEISSTELRKACFEAYKALKASEGFYTPESRAVLAETIRETRTGILRDLDDDHVTNAYNQTAIAYQTALLKLRVKQLSRGEIRIIFNANGGVCDAATRKYYLGDTCGALPTATKSRYVLDGWYTAPEGGTRISEDMVFTEESEQTWYAQWTPDGFWIAGDADQDGTCSVRDVTLIMRYLAGGWNAQPDFDHADVNADSVLNLRDIALLRRFLAGGWGVTIR